MGRKKKLPEDYAKEHEEEFEVKVIWKDLVGLGDSSIKVPESALVCKFCDTFVKPKGSRISEHLISARHNEMKKRAAGKMATDLSFLPNLQLKLEQQNLCAQELVRALAIAGVTQPSSVPAILSLSKGQKGGILQEVWDMKNVMETYLPIVFNKYLTEDLASLLKGRRLNLYIDNSIEINNIPGVALYAKFYDMGDEKHKELLLDVSPLPVCDSKVLAAYTSFLLQKLGIPWSTISTVSVTSLDDIGTLTETLKCMNPHIVVLLCLATQISTACITTLTTNLPNTYNFVFQLTELLSSQPSVTRKYLQMWSTNGETLSKAILPPKVKPEDILSWTTAAELLLSIWKHVESFCGKFKDTPEFLILRSSLVNLDQIHFDLQRLVKFLSPVCVIVRALKHGLLTDKINEIMTRTLIEVSCVEPSLQQSHHYPVSSLHNPGTMSKSPLQHVTTTSPCTSKSPISSLQQTQTSGFQHSPNLHLQSSFMVNSSPGASSSGLTSPLTNASVNISSNNDSNRDLGASSQLSMENKVFPSPPSPTTQISTTPLSSSASVFLPRLTSCFSLHGNGYLDSINNSSPKQTPVSQIRQPIRPLPLLPTTTTSLNSGSNFSPHLTSAPPAYSALPTFLSSHLLPSSPSPLSSISSSSLSSTSSPSSLLFTTSLLSPPHSRAGGQDLTTSAGLPTSSTNTVNLSSSNSSKENRHNEAPQCLSSPGSPTFTKRHCSEPAISLQNELRSKELKEFCVEFRGRLTALIAGSFHTNILGQNSFFDRFSVFNPVPIEDSSSIPKTIEHFEPILRIFSQGDWTLEKRDLLGQEIDAYFKFISSTKLNIDSLSYWKLLRTALPNLGLTVLNSLGIYTGSSTLLSKHAMQQAIEDPNVNLSFDNLIRLCIINHNRNVVSS